jgi:hypothetical protein
MRLTMPAMHYPRKMGVRGQLLCNLNADTKQGCVFQRSWTHRDARKRGINVPQTLGLVLAGSYREAGFWFLHSGSGIFM